MRWTEQQLADYFLSHGMAGQKSPPFQLPANRAGWFASGKLTTRKMNKTESAYADYLRNQRDIRKIHWFEFEAVKLRLADNTYYTPDFVVLPADGVLAFHEVKGHWRDDARVKIKIAAALFPFKFIAATKKKAVGGWEWEEFS